MQVYRGRLREGGREVAVKVQRPGVRESIALDIHILRILAAFVKRWRRLNSDLPALLDEVEHSALLTLLVPTFSVNLVMFAKNENYGQLLEGILCCCSGQRASSGSLITRKRQPMASASRSCMGIWRYPSILDSETFSAFHFCRLLYKVEIHHEYISLKGILIFHCRQRLVLTSVLQGVYVPDMILEHTTQRVLVMEWIEGRRLRRAGKNGEGPSADELREDLKLVEIGVQCSLEQVCNLNLYPHLTLLHLYKCVHGHTTSVPNHAWTDIMLFCVQILEVGFHHADPHPGNLLRLEGGRLGYIDFGMMGNIEGPIRK